MNGISERNSMICVSQTQQMSSCSSSSSRQCMYIIYDDSIQKTQMLLHISGGADVRTGRKLKFSALFTIFQ